MNVLVYTDEKGSETKDFSVVCHLRLLEGFVVFLMLLSKPKYHITDSKNEKSHHKFKTQENTQTIQRFFPAI